MEIKKKWPKFIVQAEAIESAVVMKGGSTRDLHIMIGNKIDIEGHKINKIIITEEALQDYGKISPFGNLIIDIEI